MTLREELREKLTLELFQRIRPWPYTPHELLDELMPVLYARIRALPSPLYRSGAMTYCSWCAAGFVAEGHPPNGCLFAEAHASEQERGR